MYAQMTLKDEMDDLGYNINKETDSNLIHVCKIVLELTGIVRKRMGKWHLTQKGQKLTQPGQRRELFQEIFQTFTTKYNWAYLDAYGHPQAGQMAFAFSMSMLTHFGKTDRLARFYADKYIEAFPMLLEELMPPYYGSPQKVLTDCFISRFFSRFAVWWGLVEMVEPFDIFKARICPVRKRELLDELFIMPTLEG